MSVYTQHRPRLERYLLDHGDLQPEGPIQIGAAELQQLRRTLGGRVVAALAGTPNPAFGQLFDRFNLETAGFAWQPTQSYSVARVLETLDGTRSSGECKILAGALLSLWLLPPPFGLGKARANPKASLYTFENYDPDNGFVSFHPRQGIRGLRPNILHPMGNASDVNAVQPLYQWGDHKVVFYDGKLWDPSYKRIWDREEEMVAFEFTGQHAATDRDAYQVRVVTGEPSRGWLTNQHMFMRFDMLGGGWKGPYRDIR